MTPGRMFAKRLAACRNSGRAQARPHANCDRPLLTSLEPLPLPPVELNQQATLEVSGMAEESRSPDTGGEGSTGPLRGFASMSQEKQREIARKGGANVPHGRNAASLRIAAWRPRQDARAARPWLRRTAASRRTAPWLPQPAARAVRCPRAAGRTPIRKISPRRRPTHTSPPRNSTRGWLIGTNLDLECCCSIEQGSHSWSAL